MVIVIRDVKNYVIIINLLAGDPWRPRACVKCKWNDRCSGDQRRQGGGRGGVRAAVGECDGRVGGPAADVQEHECEAFEI